MFRVVFNFIFVFYGVNVFCLDYKHLIKYCLDNSERTGNHVCYWPDCRRRVDGFRFKGKESLRDHLNRHKRVIEGRITENDIKNRKALKK